jgi:hypothetical protein
MAELLEKLKKEVFRMAFGHLTAPGVDPKSVRNLDRYNQCQSLLGEISKWKKSKKLSEIIYVKDITLQEMFVAREARVCAFNIYKESMVSDAIKYHYLVLEVMGKDSIEYAFSLIYVGSAMRQQNQNKVIILKSYFIPAISILRVHMFNDSYKKPYNKNDIDLYLEILSDTGQLCIEFKKFEDACEYLYEILKHPDSKNYPVLRSKSLVRVAMAHMNLDQMNKMLDMHEIYELECGISNIYYIDLHIDYVLTKYEAYSRMQNRERVEMIAVTLFAIRKNLDTEEFEKKFAEEHDGKIKVMTFTKTLELLNVENLRRKSNGLPMSDIKSNYRVCCNCSRIMPKKDIMKCSGCLKMYYCSVKCQVEDWKAYHKLLCKRLDRNDSSDNCDSDNNVSDKSTKINDEV